MAGNGRNGESRDNPVAINVTAMVDVIFCLCIFFMCSFHFKQLEGRIDAWMPKGGSEPAVEEVLPNEIRVIMQWDVAGDRLLRSVGNDDYVGSDEELMHNILERAEGYRKVGTTDWDLLIDAESDVPWEGVMHVMDLCTLNAIERIRFAAPEAPVER
jgi:biopolymer transport protein ExbD